jgi:nucleoside phosphorylase
LPLEARAVREIFKTEEVHDQWGRDREAREYQRADADTNAYSIGRISDRDVVLVHMPDMGTTSAASVASNLKSSFRRIRLALLVGICGGVPQETPEQIMLGDVILGKHVVQYDFGRQYPGVFKRKSSPNETLGRQNPEIRAFVAKLESRREDLVEETFRHLTELLTKPLHENTLHPDGLEDILFLPSYPHKHNTIESCSNKACFHGDDACEDARNSLCEELECDISQAKYRRAPKAKPGIHFGSIASGNAVMKSASDRDRLAERENIIAFDTEAAGVWEYLPCVIVKAVCDYADSHKNKKWQPYAALTAAACAKAILNQWPRTDKRPVQVSFF